MAPSIPAKTLILFDRLALTPEEGDVIAVAIPTEGFDIGRYRIIKGRGHVVPDNPNYKPRKIGRNVRLVGTMVEWHCPGSR